VPVTAPARLIILATFAVMVGACDHGGAFIAENKTDQELIARVTGSEQVPASSSIRHRPRQDLLALPANSRLAIEVLGFKDPFNVQKIEILTTDCVAIATFAQASGVAFARDGQVIIIDPGPTANLRREFPQTGTLAAKIERCSDQSPVASPTAVTRSH
jgi:hypothetical protein